MQTIWIEPISLESIRTRSKDTLATQLGIEFVEIGDNFLSAKMPVDARTRQPLGILNGGASCALAETVASTAANYCVKQSEAYCVGLDINANHLRPAREGYVIGTAHPIHLGKKTHVWQIDIDNEKNQRVCIARLTLMVMMRTSHTT